MPCPGTLRCCRSCCRASSRSPPPTARQVRAAVEDGFLSIANDRVSILSEDAFLADEIDAEAARAEVEKLQGEDDPLALQRAEAKVRAAEKMS